ncbi:TetR/AcrR family transcriptional regulator [Psychrobacillus glaciei]|uniref:TetR/AcrR family transcriptional regulator n=1 Tax=Psychrobacillus glaciei TaxID=2283160 RepID=A0A5J6SIX0_9BACI|nr:TetR/AcrR family transcriptional regulator [Psychrobacillus glaciei]QFF97549.1 TetR/AcrR family transcriptional regulator [Psychrobacillus glaciei]
MVITKRFENLDVKKQKRIIDAALNEFKEKGFDQASTNQIVKKAGIGKGMLFYYFKTKQDLYLYLIEYCLEMVENEYFEEINSKEPDLLERMKQIVVVKMDFLSKYPEAINFIATIILNDQIDADLKSRIETLYETGYARIYGNIDYTFFKEGMDVQKAFNLIRWSIEGYENELKRRLKGQDLSAMDYDSYVKEFLDYINIMRALYYK